MHRTLRTALLATFALAACGDDSDNSPDDVGTDAVADTTDASDAAGDTTADADTQDDVDPADVADATLDTADASDADAADVQPDVPPLDECEAVALPEPDAVDAEQTRFALTMFHFNVEYVIGGLEYPDPDTGRMIQFLGLELNEGWDNDRVEDYIIEETLRPMLDMYANHPEWRTTFELQAYAIEVMAERHPETLLLLRELAQRGQVELVSFHYAAQLFLAYPREDQERSLAETRAIFEKYCLPLSDVVFNQEGQAGEGRQQLLVDEGWRIGVQPVNLWRYVRDGETPWPYYASEGGILVVGPGGVDPESGIEVTWPFFDDGELRAVAQGINPYAAALGPHVPARVTEYEEMLQQLEDEGWKHTSIGDYVHQLEGMDIELRDAPPLLDGTWQPPSTDSIHRWLGGRSQANVGDEEDNRVRSGNAVARMHADATQVLLEVAAEAGHTSDEWDAEMHEIWRQLWHAEVSDASGVNPWRAEVLWCLALNDEVAERTEALRGELLDALEWEFVEIDLENRTAQSIEGIPMPEPPTPADPWFVFEIEAEGRDVDVDWFEAGAENRRQLVVNFSASEGCEDCDDRRISLGFLRTADAIAYTPALIEDEVRTYPFSDFSFLNDEVYLPLANGLIGLGNDLWIIKHTRTMHIAARVSPSDDHIRFIDAAIWRETPSTWVFDIFEGSAEDALALANRINTDPVSYYAR